MTLKALLILLKHLWVKGRTPMLRCRLKCWEVWKASTGATEEEPRESTCSKNTWLQLRARIQRINALCRTDFWFWKLQTIISRHERCSVWSNWLTWPQPRVSESSSSALWQICTRLVQIGKAFLCHASRLYAWGVVKASVWERWPGYSGFQHSACPVRDTVLQNNTSPGIFEDLSSKERWLGLDPSCIFLKYCGSL